VNFDVHGPDVTVAIAEVAELPPALLAFERLLARVSATVALQVVGVLQEHTSSAGHEGEYSTLLCLN